MGVKASERAEENLPLQAESGARLHDLRYLFQLAANESGWKRCLQRREAREGGGKNFALLERLRHDGACILHERNSRIESEQLLETDEPRVLRRRAAISAKARS